MVKRLFRYNTCGRGRRFLYITRLKKLDPNMQVDLLVCQLSTNDASQEKELGKISDSDDISDYDTKTITGAMEYIIAYAKGDVELSDRILYGNKV